MADPDTGAVLNAEMPWWSLPEAVRAAARVMAVTEDTDRDRASQILQTASDMYFGNFLGDYYDFPVQTRSGETGEVIDRVPAVPEGDPLYHSNLAFLDTLSVIR